MVSNIAIAGAGFSGATVARQLAEAGYDVTIFDPRHHVAGNCHTARDDETGVMVHVYGPHIFHTDDEGVWQFVQRFGEMVPFRHTVMAQAQGQVFALPINLGTINQLFATTYSPAQAKAALRDLSADIDTPANFEEQALSMVGARIYETFFQGYTRKQWGRDPITLPASILKRLPLRFSYDGAYFNHRHQAIPRDGYTDLVAQMVEHPRITLRLGEAFDPKARDDWHHVFWTGPLDAFFDHCAGRLSYRTLDFERTITKGDAQGCAVMNYCDGDVAWTRITEHKHFAPWEDHEGTVLYREFSREAGPDDVPFYPVRLAEDKGQLCEYIDRAKQLERVTFLGRLGTYRYLDMDVTIREALDVAAAFIAAQDTPDMARGDADVEPPIFSKEPL